MKADIRNMSKEELRDYMTRVTHELGLPEGRYRYDSENVTWKHAFKLARLNGMESVELDCQKCAEKVAEWMVR